MHYLIFCILKNKQKTRLVKGICWETLKHLSICLSHPYHAVYPDMHPLIGKMLGALSTGALKHPLTFPLIIKGKHWPRTTKLKITVFKFSACIRYYTKICIMCSQIGLNMFFGLYKIRNMLILILIPKKFYTFLVSEKCQN